MTSVSVYLVHTYTSHINAKIFIKNVLPVNQMLKF